MADSKNFLQNIKLEISRNFKLKPYERIAFHQVMGILKTDAAFEILRDELRFSGEIRQSAIKVLSGFDKPELLDDFIPLLKDDISEDEILDILGYIERHGDERAVEPMIEYINDMMNVEVPSGFRNRAFISLGAAGKGNDDVLNFLLPLIHMDEIDSDLLTDAVYAFESLGVISTYEELLRRNLEPVTHAVFLNLQKNISKHVDTLQAIRDEENLYSYTRQDEEDKVLLDVRVLLGKMAASFDDFSSRVKTAFVATMMATNHREYLIYVMKCLTAGDPELLTMTLYTVFSNIRRLRDPDKLFRSLISLSVENEIDNDIVVKIFTRYFSWDNNSRQFHIQQDKMYNYIVVTLETFFETYRREYMITNVKEKGYPEVFQNIRELMLEEFSPKVKKRILYYLREEDPSIINQLINDIARDIHYIPPEREEVMKQFVEVLFDNDEKARLNTISRLEDVDFEKRYLRGRIIRLLKVIASLSIEEAASPLVNIYNYLRKYPDYQLVRAVMNTLSSLNYSYMLGEIEVMLSTGSEEDIRLALSLLSLYSEQRSLNLLMEYIQKNVEDVSDTTRQALSVLVEREIKGNVSVAQLLRNVITNNPEVEIYSLAILGLGRCGFTADLDFLHELFFRITDNEPKDVIVRSIGYIVNLASNVNARQLIRSLQEYQKDPGIRVRIYSGLIMAQLGYEDAVRQIREMLIIKNKDIQRDILMVLGELRSLEFAFFLMSLMNDEYAISSDIILILKKLKEEDLKEIDAFVINLFRRHEAPALPGEDTAQKKISVQRPQGLREYEALVLRVLLYGQQTDSIPELISHNLMVKDLFLGILTGNGGTITQLTAGETRAWYRSPQAALEASMALTKRIEAFNETRVFEHRLDAVVQLAALPVKELKGELLLLPEHQLSMVPDESLTGKIMLDEGVFRQVNREYYCRPLPSVVTVSKGCLKRHYEAMTPDNFRRVSEKIMEELSKEEETRAQMQEQIEAELKRLRMENRPASSAAITRDLENIGGKLQAQLDEIERYIQRRSTDRELNRNVRKMLANTLNLYKVEISRLIIE